MRRLPPLLTAAAAALALAGCNETATTRAPGRVVEIRISDYRYEPQNVSIRRGRVTFAITNAGREPTNFRVRGRGRRWGTIATMQPGEYGTMTIDLKRGRYTMFSSVGRHEELGEYGTLRVR